MMMLHDLYVLAQGPQRLWKKAKIHPKGDWADYSAEANMGTFHVPSALDSLFYPVIIIFTFSSGLNKVLKQACKKKRSAQKTL